MAAKFSPSDAALSVFSFARANTAFTLRFMAIFAVFSVIVSILVASSGVFEYSNFMNSIAATGREPNEKDLAEALALINVPMFLMFALFGLIVGSIVQAMALRKTVLNKDTLLQFGQDEKNLIFGNLGLAAIFALFVFVTIIFLSILGLILAQGDGKAGILSVISLVIMVLGLIFIYGRCGQFGVFAIANNEMGLKSSFQYTKHEFWSFVGAYVLSGVILMIMSIIVTRIISIILNAILPDAFFVANANSLQDLLKIGNIMLQLISGAVSGFLNLAFICVGAYIYHQQPSQSQINTDGNMV